MLAASTAAAALTSPTPRPPNILLILSDDHRWDALGVAGNHAIRTPNLDRLANEGVYFRQAAIHVPECAPSRATLLTGLPTHQHGVFTNRFQRETVRTPGAFEQVATVPRLLQDRGYHTVLVGKWHLAAAPWRSGFAETRIWMPDGQGAYRDPELARGNSWQKSVVPGYTQQIFTDDAVGFLRSDAAKRQPFFLWFSPTAPHFPGAPNPPEAARPYAGKSAQELAPKDLPATATAGTWRDYYSSVSELDRQVGRLLAALDEAGHAENTVVVFLGDNGFLFGEGGWQGKLVPYEGSVRVPLIVRLPRGARGPCDAPVSSLDLPPTLLALAGLAPPAPWPGRDFSAFLQGRGAIEITEAVSEHQLDEAATNHPRNDRGSRVYRTVRTATHKLIVWPDPAKQSELYDLAADPFETMNQIDDPALTTVRDDLHRRLGNWIRRTGDPARAWFPDAD